MTALHGPTARGGWIVEIDQQGSRKTLGIKSLPHVFRQRRERRLEAAFAGSTHGLKRSTQACECSASEALHVLLAAECSEGFLPFGENIFRLETPLRKHSAILL